MVAFHWFFVPIYAAWKALGVIQVGERNRKNALYGTKQSAAKIFA